MESGSERSELIRKIIVEGKIVPVRITCELLKKGMEKQGWNKKKFVIDGFPRNQDNYDGWTSVMGDISETPFVIFFDLSEKAMIERIRIRGKTSGRNDDTEEVLIKRFKTFHKATMPIVELYRK